MLILGRSTEFLRISCKRIQQYASNCVWNFKCSTIFHIFFVPFLLSKLPSLEAKMIVFSNAQNFKIQKIKDLIGYVTVNSKWNFN